MKNNNDNSTIYIFRESGTGNLILETKDMSVLSGIVPTQTIARTEKVIIEGVNYIVVGFEIYIVTFSSMPDRPAPMLNVKHNKCGIHTTIYLKKSFHPLRNFFINKVTGLFLLFFYLLNGTLHFTQ
ncbi:hypothetical protein FW778_01810 [Ginsengibacter hankyongi]|uniref:Uncharacterized protein n=1 Tax=Ginsengibacter hankyongi TaxID=2607284 RepID=A0A5J5IMP6_9BACT|nr:hypothetical protein [Ginsengibacter hankyongi]KAA9040802.1 hypothetical protein FW778_01810 [Ginsengibacter hankyongi]